MADKSFDFAPEMTLTPSSSGQSSMERPEPALVHATTEHEVEKTQSRTSQISRKSTRQARRVKTAQDWDGPDDPGNPLNWNIGKKIFHVIIPASQCFVVTFGSSVYTPSVHAVQQQFNISLETAIIPLTLYVLGLGFGPTISAPISETFGRRVTYLFFFPLSLLFTLGAGFSQNLASLLVCRFLAGILGSGCLAVGAGTNSDLFPPFSRAAASALFLLAPFLGPAIGPLVGGFATEAKGWRWTQWTILMAGLPAFLITIPSSETYKKIILQRRAKALDLPPPPNPMPKSLGARLKFILIVTLLRPVHMLLTEPIVGFMSTYTAFNFSVLFAFFAAFPLVFSSTHAPQIEIYHLSLGLGGTTFLGIGIGCILAAGLFILIDALYYKPRTHRRRAAGDQAPLNPEHRLPAAMLGSILLPIGLFWFAWTARADVSPLVPLAGSIFFGAGNLLVFTATMLYTIDTYGPLLGASAAAANGIMRYVFGAIFPLFAVQMYLALGVGWATSLLGFVTVAMLPLPWVLFRWGPGIRERSKFASMVVGGSAMSATKEKKGEVEVVEPAVEKGAEQRRSDGTVGGEAGGENV